MPNHAHLIDFLKQNQDGIQQIVLATIVETQGSAYQKAGTKALILPDGSWVGVISGGCLEHDLAQQAQNVFATGETKIVNYALTNANDEVWGHGLGCLGSINVLLKLLNADNKYFPLNQIVACSDQGKSGALVTVIQSNNPEIPIGTSYFADIQQDGKITINMPEPMAILARNYLQGNKPSIRRFKINDECVSVFVEPILPPTRLLLIGAGKDSEPLVTIAKTLGWQVTVVDHRPTILANFNVNQVDCFLNLAPHELAEKLNLNRFDAAVVMTHNLDYDSRYLSVLSETSIAFIGLLGPAHRKARVLEKMGNKSTLLGNRLHGPLGLDIGSETPAEIALSIVAGIQAALKGKSGAQLTAIIDQDRVQQHG